MTHLLSLPGTLHKARAMASALCAAALCAGCASLSPPPPVDILPTTPPPLAAVPRAAKPVNGSLFSSASYRPAFEDRRARLVGDSVTENDIAPDAPIAETQLDEDDHLRPGFVRRVLAAVEIAAPEAPYLGISK